MLPDKLRRFAKWIGTTLAESLVALMVAAAVSSAMTFVLLRWERSFQTEFYAMGEGGEVAYPEEMFKFARAEGYAIEFDPPELEQVAVCDYSSESGRSWWDLARDYLQKYPDCFQISKIGERAIKVRPNETPCSMLAKVNNSYWCNCPPEYLGPD